MSIHSFDIGRVASSVNLACGASLSQHGVTYKSIISYECEEMWMNGLHL